MNLKNLAVPLALLMLDSTGGKPHDPAAVQATDSDLTWLEEAPAIGGNDDFSMSWLEKAREVSEIGEDNKWGRESWHFDVNHRQLCAAHLASLLDEEDLTRIPKILDALQEMAMRLHDHIQATIIPILKVEKETTEATCRDDAWNHDPREYRADLREAVRLSHDVRALIYSFKLEFEQCMDKDVTLCEIHESLVQLKNHFGVILDKLDIIRNTFAMTESGDCFKSRPLVDEVKKVIQNADSATFYFMGFHDILFEAATRHGLRYRDTLFDYLRSWPEKEEVQRSDKRSDRQILQLAYHRYQEAQKND